MREIVHIQAGQCGNQIGTKVRPHDHMLLFCFQGSNQAGRRTSVEHLGTHLQAARDQHRCTTTCTASF